MKDQARPEFSIIIKDNEQAVAQAFADKHFVQTYLLVHGLVEALLRMFLRINKEEKVNFNELIQKYRSFLEKERYPIPTFIDELTQFNRRRNRVVHELWRRGYSLTNSQTESAARGAVMMYNLLIEWLETFDPEITHIGFRYDEDI